jgi:GntR family transcriptional regulator/MocR family aminotransferase
MAISRTSSAPELLVPLRRDGGEPLARQLEQQLREAVRSERLAPDAALPSSRALAAQVGVARGVVVAAYEQLVAEGYLISRPGGSTRVARVPGTPARPRPASTPPAFDIDFRPGRPDLREFPRATWLRSVRRVMAQAPAASLGYLGGHGSSELRDALATYLNRSRGTCISPNDIVISTGFAQGIQVIVRALLSTGARRIGLEDPYHPDYRAMITGLGAEAVPVPIDDDGMRVDLLDGLRLDAVVVTPAHQYPTGAVLSPERRAALLEWAERHDATIIEDDYDAEFRYDRDPIGAVQGLCSDRTVYAGTASKTLAPGLRLGWLAAPRRLVEPIAAAVTPCWRRSAGTCPMPFPSARPPASISSPGCRPAPMRSRSSRAPRKPGSASPRPAPRGVVATPARGSCSATPRRTRVGSRRAWSAWPRWSLDPCHLQATGRWLNRRMSARENQSAPSGAGMSSMRDTPSAERAAGCLQVTARR